MCLFIEEEIFCLLHCRLFTLLALNRYYLAIFVKGSVNDCCLTFLCWQSVCLDCIRYGKVIFIGYINREKSKQNTGFQSLLSFISAAVGLESSLNFCQTLR